jgi:hypothetical protein
VRESCTAEKVYFAQISKYSNPNTATEGSAAQRAQVLSGVL